jgi:CheY-like chemotaxis protein
MPGVACVGSGVVPYFGASEDKRSARAIAGVPGVVVVARARTVLVVEDDEDTRLVLGECLRGEGYRVVEAAEADAALAALAVEDVDAILSDAALTGTWDSLTPWRVPALLRKAAPSTPIVVCSAHAPRIFAEYATRGFDGFVPKPFDIETLLTTVERCLPPR